MTTPAPRAVLPAAPRKAHEIRAAPPARGGADQEGNLGAEEAALSLAYDAHGRGPEERGMCRAALRAHRGAGRGKDEANARLRAVTSPAPEIDTAAVGTDPVFLTGGAGGSDAGGSGPSDTVPAQTLVCSACVLARQVRGAPGPPGRGPTKEGIRAP